MDKLKRYLSSFTIFTKTSLFILLFFSLFYIFSKDSIPDSITHLLLHQSSIHISTEKPENKHAWSQTENIFTPTQASNEKPDNKHDSPQTENISTPIESSDDKPLSINDPKLNDELEYEFFPFVKLYKSGRVERLSDTPLVPPNVDYFTGVNSKDIRIDEKTGVSVRLYLPKQRDGIDLNNQHKLPVLLYFHGGAFVIESAFSACYHYYLNVLVSKAQVVAVSVDYRLAPEHRLPAAYEDAWMALKWALMNCRSGPDPWLFNHGDINQIFLGGDSAGGNIAHDAAIRAGKYPSQLGIKIKGLILSNPYFWGKDPVGTESSDRWMRESFEKNWEFVCGGLMGIDHPAVNPLTWMEGLKNLGCERVIVTVAGRDIFRERGMAYVKGLKDSGWHGEVDVYENRDESHCYFIFDPLGKKAAKEMKAVTEFLNRL